VDDIILTASTTALLRSIIQSLHGEFSMTDIGDLHHFLGINVHRSDAALFLSQQQYALELLERANMIGCKPIGTPVDSKAKLSAADGILLLNPSEYRSLAGALQYLMLTRPDIAYAVQHACQFMHAPRDVHLQLIKRILCYVRGTTQLGLHIHRHSPTFA
jgi:hypothetical protein